MPEATTETKIPNFPDLEESGETKGARFIRIKNPTESDSEYVSALLQNPNNIRQSDLRDNMSLFECDEKGIWNNPREMENGDTLTLTIESQIK